MKKILLLLLFFPVLGLISCTNQEANPSIPIIEEFLANIYSSSPNFTAIITDEYCERYYEGLPPIIRYYQGNKIADSSPAYYHPTDIEYYYETIDSKIFKYYRSEDDLWSKSEITSISPLYVFDFVLKASDFRPTNQENVFEILPQVAYSLFMDSITLTFYDDGRVELLCRHGDNPNDLWVKAECFDFGKTVVTLPEIK